MFNFWKIVSGEEVFSGEFLLDIGYEFVCVRIGDILFFNVVIVGVSDFDGIFYFGRVGGNVFCVISIDGDRIKYFCFYVVGVK